MYKRVNLLEDTSRFYVQTRQFEWDDTTRYQIWLEIDEVHCQVYVYICLQFVTLIEQIFLRSYQKFKERLFKGTQDGQFVKKKTFFFYSILFMISSICA